MIQRTYVSVLLLSVFFCCLKKGEAEVLSLKKLMQRKQAVVPQPQPALPQQSNQQVSVVPLVPLPTNQQSMQDKPTAVVDSQPIINQASIAHGPDTYGKSVDEIGIQGNWMKKRAWVLRAFELSDQIQKLLIGIHETRAAFAAKYTAIDDDMDQFYRTVGVEQGKLEQIYGSIKRYLEKLRAKEQENLVESPRPYFESLENARDGVDKLERQLAQLRLTMDSITELDRSLEARLKKADETIVTAQHIATGETELLDKLWYVIDDKKAQAIYFQIKNGVLAKVRAAHEYLTSKLMQDFDGVVAKIQEQIKEVRTVIDQLEAAGIIVKDRAQRLENLKQQATQEQEKERAEYEAARKAAKKRAQKNRSVAWYLQPIVLMYDGIIQVCAWLYGAVRTIILLIVPSKTQPAKQSSSVEEKVAQVPQRPDQVGETVPAVQT